MRILLHCSTWIAAIASVFLWMPVADAHPLGNFTINHYAGVQVAQDDVAIDYVLDMAEIPAFQEINQIDTNHNRKPDSAETVNYPAEKCREVKSHLALQVNQQPLALSLNNAIVEFPPGVGGLATLRLTCGFQSAVGSATTVSTTQRVEFEDNFYPQRLGWREITVTAAEGVSLQGNVTASSITNRLTEYPTDLLSSPLNQRQISFEINPSSFAQPIASVPTRSDRSDQALAGRSNDAFTRLITLEENNVFTVLVALAIAFVWGGLHALSPGHGKTIVGAYLVGSRGKAQHALLLGLTVTLTHTAGIFALGLLMLGTSRFILTEQLYPWLSGLSGVLMTGIGLKLLINHLRGSQLFQNWTWRQGYTNLAYSHGELSPAHHHHEHLATHHAHHTHHHGEHSHHGEHTHDHGHSDHSGHSHHGEHTHSHGQKAHSHLPPGADGSAITWSSILALGISGGILPCPSALVVLLSAIALGRIGFGLALVSAFSLGLASVLTAIGLILVYARDWFEQLPLQSPNSKLFPAASALLITLIGLGITTKALFTHVL
ncbi:MAG: sulfite exporter TauE/SafE family protein [Myxacorys chilensis ATA2-1-KO14]|jgi:ABC-type nickel/cobalt efflux system permease component RcnA|nr:sulfite exporter TauE/SafE family protein [Myxacorys chilensis ATA2-1-KO14]